MIVSWHNPDRMLHRGDGGTVDAGDLKSPDRKVVRVRVPLAPPTSQAICLYSYRSLFCVIIKHATQQYQVSVDKRSGIVSDPNNLDDEAYIVRLVG